MSTEMPVKVGSHTNLSGTHGIGNGATRPPSKSPHRKDTIESQSEETSQGIIGYGLLWISYFVSSVFNGLSVVVSILKWPLVQLGILSAGETEETSPVISVEDLKKGWEATFDKSSHAERLRLLAFKIATWEDSCAEAFFIHLFNKQDKRVLEELARTLEDGFDTMEIEAIMVAMPKLIFEAYSTKPEKRILPQIRLAEDYHNFLLEFPDYALAYVETLFGKDEPSSRRFEGLALLVRHVGNDKDFHVEQIDGVDTVEAMQNAIPKYYGKLSQVEREKLLSFFDADEFHAADAELLRFILEKREDIEVVKLFSEVTGYEGTESGFRSFLVNLMDTSFNIDEDWVAIKPKVLAQFPNIRVAYAKGRDDVFLKADWQVQAAHCEYAQESEPNIYKMRLGTIVNSVDEEEVYVANERILHHYAQGAIALFMAYRDQEITRLMKDDSLSKGEAEQKIVDKWASYFGFNEMEISSREAFNREMHQVEMTSQYKAGAKAILDGTFVRRA